MGTLGSPYLKSMKTYYIYHIPGIKIGCTSDLQKRMSDQGFIEWEILETHIDGWLAGDREIELQKEYGYRVDTSHYMISLQNRPRWNDKTRQVPSRESCVLGGKVTGRKNVESGHLARVRDPHKAMLASLKRITCEHCGKDANTGNYKRWHGDNCKHKS